MFSELQDHKYARRLKTLEDLRWEREQDWLDIQKYVFPRKGLFWRRGQKVKYKREHSSIIDPEAIFDLKDLASMLLIGMTPKTRPWLRMTLQNQDLMDLQEVKDWFHNVTKIMLSVYSWSNLYNSLFNVYCETPAFGTGAMMEDIHHESLVKFTTFTTGEYYIAVNEFGIVDTFYRMFEMTANNIVGRFGEDNVSDSIREAVKNADGKDKYFPVCHAIQPNDEAKPNMLDNRNMPFSEVYWERKEAKKKLLETGHEEFPVFCPRWDIVSTQSTYGEGVARDVLGHVKSLQEMAKGKIKAVHKENDPPMRIPANFKGRLSLVPGAQNVDPNPDGKGISRLFDMNFDYQGVSETILDIRDQLKRGFFVDLIRLLTSRRGIQPLSAEEVVKQGDEQLILISPILERFHSDLLNPLNKRTFNILLRAGILPEPPQIIQGQQMKVEYTSLLAQAQKLIGLRPIETFLGFIGETAQLNPDTLDKVDFDEMIDEYGDAAGIPPKIIVSEETVKAIRDARAKKIMEQEQMEMALAASKGVKDVGGMSTEQGTVLGDIVGNV